jgi:YfiH family protein
MELTWLKVPQWQRHHGLLHGFMGRRGGRSTGSFSGLNLSFRAGDDARVVKDNMCDLKGAVGIHDGRVVTMKQVHGDRIVEVRDRSLKEAGEADGIVTGEKDIFLGVLTADCVPILVVAPGKKLAAAIHAGWRGSLAGIVFKTVRLFLDEHNILPSDLEVALGPSIDACCYEIRDDVAKPLIERWGHLAETAIQTRDQKSYLHLRNLHQAILRRAGVPQSQIFQIGPCTSCTTEDFFSYRKAKKETGRQISFIGWAR